MNTDELSSLEKKVENFRNMDVRPLNYQDIGRATSQGMDPFARDGHDVSSCANDFVEDLTERALKGEPCWFCGSKLLSAFRGGEYESDGFRGLFVCPSCTWTHSYHCEINNPDIVPLVESVSFLYSSNLSSKEECLTTVAMELVESWSKVHELHPAKLEEFVAAVLKGVYDCETKWVGRSGDGGVDVIALISDRPLVVQVKRRMRVNHVEGVSIVREFCGAMLARGDRDGMIVTTANHFSPSAIECANSVVTTPVISRLDLVDSRMLSDLFKLVRTDYDNWKKAFHSR